MSIPQHRPDDALREARAPLPQVPFDALRGMVRLWAAEHDLTVEQDAAAGIALRTAYGQIAFAPDGRGAVAHVTTPRLDFLQALRDSVVGHLSHAWPEAARGLRWSDADPGADGAGAPDPDALPDNVRLMTLAGVEVLDCGFLRVTLAGDVTRFSDDAIHFRLGIPPVGRAPCWPRIGANGATVWPTGANALHLPVYTARYIDRAAGRLVFDLFAHEGGRALAWARSMARGVEVAVIGPGGGTAQITGEIRGFADETAFPAIARVIERNPDLTGEICLFGSGAARRYPMPPAPGVTMRWYDPEEMGTRAAAALAAAPDAWFWLAGERTCSQDFRRAYKATKPPQGRSYIAAYWQRAAAPV